ncbi:DnaT-like ssDNA-binding protein [Microbaculum marinum]|uniref:DnaT-like ssDNA-binding protein n=1 Tax=Microbaculum marinum TaxID=1764581 RepID=A0AAW9RG59_9HYPH
MALTVEDGTGLAGAESYVSASDADTYHSARGNSAWIGSEDEKEEALRKAAEYLDGRYRGRWKGVRGSKAQALAWPRARVVDEDGYSVSSTTVPNAVVAATCEAALLILSGTDLSPTLTRENFATQEEVKVGPIEESRSYSSGAPTKPVVTRIEQKLSGLLTSGTGGGAIFLQRA